jgi:plastocyanin
MGRSVVQWGGRWGLALLLGVGLILSACGGDADAGGSNAAEGQDAEGAAGTPVTIANFVYEPQEVQVAPGTKVTWTNKDSAIHNVQDLSDLNIPISRHLPQDYKYSIRYDKPGSYPYNCSLHPYMTGTVKVV